MKTLLIVLFFLISGFTQAQWTPKLEPGGTGYFKSVVNSDSYLGQGAGLLEANFLFAINGSGDTANFLPTDKKDGIYRSTLNKTTFMGKAPKTVWGQNVYIMNLDDMLPDSNNFAGLHRQNEFTDTNYFITILPQRIGERFSEHSTQLGEINLSPSAGIYFIDGSANNSDNQAFITTEWVEGASSILNFGASGNGNIFIFDLISGTMTTGTTTYGNAGMQNSGPITITATDLTLTSDNDIVLNGGVVVYGESLPNYIKIIVDTTNTVSTKANVLVQLNTAYTNINTNNYLNNIPYLNGRPVFADLVTLQDSLKIGSANIIYTNGKLYNNKSYSADSIFSTGGFYLNGNNINTNGTLSNIPYLNGNNAFTGRPTWADLSTFNDSLGLFSVGYFVPKNSAGVRFNKSLTLTDTLYSTYINNGNAIMGNVTLSNMTISGGAGAALWTNRLQLFTPSDGVAVISNWAGTGMTRLTLGTVDASGISITKNGTTVEAKLGDGSNYAGFKSLSLTTDTPVGGTAGTWKLGILKTDGVALTASTTNYIQVDIGGVLYKLMIAQ